MNNYVFDDISQDEFLSFCEFVKNKFNKTDENNVLHISRLEEDNLNEIAEQLYVEWLQS